MRNSTSHIRRCCLALLLAAPLMGKAQTDTLKNELTIGLNVMSHGEACNGGLGTYEVAPGEKWDEEAAEEYLSTHDKSHFLMNRTRLTVDFKRPGLEARLVGQNLAVWGAKGNTAFTVYEAWAKLSTPKGLFMQVGRQQLAYDDERILGPNDWAMTALSHDVLRMGYEGHGHKAHAILGYNQNSDNVYSGSTYYKDGAQPYKTMQTVWYHYDVPKIPLGASILFMNIGMQAGKEDDKSNPAHIEWQQLLGSYVKYSPEHWSLEGSYYHQMGHNEEGIPIDAWMASVMATWSPCDKYGFQAGYDYLSGDKYFPVPGKRMIGTILHKKVEGFNLLYGSHHKFYGAMDFFYVTTYVNGFSPGLQIAYLEAHGKPLKGLEVSAQYNYLAMATQHEDWSKHLGYELDLEVTYKISPDVKVTAGYSHMKGTETMKKLKRSENKGLLNWGWISLTVSPNLFTTKW